MDRFPGISSSDWTNWKKFVTTVEEKFHITLQPHCCSCAATCSYSDLLPWKNEKKFQMVKSSPMFMFILHFATKIFWKKYRQHQKAVCNHWSRCFFVQNIGRFYTRLPGYRMKVWQKFYQIAWFYFFRQKILRKIFGPLIKCGSCVFWKTGHLQTYLPRWKMKTW